MRRFSLLTLALLSGCIEPDAPSPAVQKLQEACQAGDMVACGKVADLEQQRRANAAAAAQAFRIPQAQMPTPMMGAPSYPRQCTYNSYGGSTVYQSCY